MNSRKILITVIGLLIVDISYGQNSNVKISGQVLDSKTNKPLAYATINIVKSSIGTVSNEAGEFNFFIPSTLDSDTLTISHIGYETLKLKVINSITAEVFYMKEAPTILNEVIVSSNDAKRLVEKSLSVIHNVYPTEPYLMEGFHRSWDKVDFTDSLTYPGTLIESAVTIYDSGYGKKNKRKSREQIYINEIRRSAIMEGWNYNRNLLDQLLNENLVRHHKTGILDVKSFLDFPNDLVYEFDGTTVIGDEKISIIKVKTSNNKSFFPIFRIYLSDKDLTILRFDLFGGKTEIDFSQGSNPWHIDTLASRYIFKRYLNKSYLSYAQTKYTIKKLDLVKKRVTQTEEYFKELLVNNVILSDVENRRKELGQKAKSRSLALEAKSYNQSF